MVSIVKSTILRKSFALISHRQWLENLYWTLLLVPTFFLFLLEINVLILFISAQFLSLVLRISSAVSWIAHFTFQTLQQANMFVYTPWCLIYSPYKTLRGKHYCWPKLLRRFACFYQFQNSFVLSQPLARDLVLRIRFHIVFTSGSIKSTVAGP